MDRPLKISFDFDGTLSDSAMQKIAKKMVDAGLGVYITTSRPFKEERNTFNNDIYRVASDCGIPQANIRFTSYTPKYPVLKDFDLHFDDDRMEIEQINRSCGCSAFHYENKPKKRLL